MIIHQFSSGFSCDDRGSYIHSYGKRWSFGVAVTIVLPWRRQHEECRKLKADWDAPLLLVFSYVTKKKYFFYIVNLPIPVAARSKAWVRGLSLAGYAGSNPGEGLDVCCKFCVLSGRGFCVGLNTLPEESYGVCVSHRGRSWSLNYETLAHWGLLGHGKRKYSQSLIEILDII
jgi:hypothetical protein